MEMNQRGISRPIILKRQEKKNKDEGLEEVS